MIRDATVKILCCDRCRSPLRDPDSDAELCFATTDAALAAAPAFGWVDVAGEILCSDTPQAQDCRATAAATPHDVVKGQPDRPVPPGLTVCVLCGEIADSAIHTDRHRVLDVDQVAIDFADLPAGVTTAANLPNPQPARRRRAAPAEAHRV